MAYYLLFQNRDNVSELLQLGVALDEFLGAASRKADAHSAIIVFALDTDHRADAIFRMPDLLPE